VKGHIFQKGELGEIWEGRSVVFFQRHRLQIFIKLNCEISMQSRSAVQYLRLSLQHRCKKKVQRRLFKTFKT